MKTLKRMAIFISLMGLAVAGCAFKKEDGPTPEAAAAEELLKTIEVKKQQQAFQGKLTKENVRVRFDETEIIGFYEMTITWPTAIATMVITIDEKTPEIRQQVEGGFLKMTVSAGNEHKINLMAYDSLGSPISSISLIEKVPSDLVIDRTFHMKKAELFDVNRVFFYDGAQLVTNGFDLTIKAKKIFVENVEFTSARVPANKAHIITTPPNTLAAEQSNLLGSKILISADQAVGTLAIALIGFNGQDGKNGADAPMHAPGALDGAPGKPGQTKSRTRPCIRGNIDIPCEPEIVICAVAATNGEDGQHGAPGFPGEDAWNGGNAGEIQIDVKNSSEFKLEVAQRVGQPGKPGVGGQGTPGGKGGPGGPKDPYCAGGAKGKDGNDGGKGGNGKKGEPGQKALIKHNLQKVEIYDL